MVHSRARSFATLLLVAIALGNSVAVAPVRALVHSPTAAAATAPADPPAPSPTPSPSATPAATAAPPSAPPSAPTSAPVPTPAPTPRPTPAAGPTATPAVEPVPGPTASPFAPDPSPTPSIVGDPTIEPTDAPAAATDPAGSETPAPTTDGAAPVSYLVRFRASADYAARANALARAGASLVSEVPELRLAVVDLPADGATDIAAALEADPAVAHVEHGRTLEIKAAPNDPQYPEQ